MVFFHFTNASQVSIFTPGYITFIYIKTNMRKNIRNIKSTLIALSLVLIVFAVLNSIYLFKISSSVAKISEQTQATCDNFYALSDELKGEKKKMSFMAHVMNIKSILDTYDNKTRSYNSMDFAYLIAKESFENNLDPLLVLAVIKTESSFRKSVVSHKGAIGLMQILPNTAQYVSSMEDHIDLVSSQELFEPTTNITIGINYLSYLVDKFENQKYAIMAYNMGPTNLVRKMRSGQQLPERYYRNVMKNYEQILTVSGRV